MLKKEQENPRKKKNLIKWRKVIIQKELKAMIMKMLTELGRPGNTVKMSTRRKYEKEPVGADTYNN